MLVYKYRGGAFERDLNALLESFFWSASVTDLNDPCEATFGNSLPDEIKSTLSFFRSFSKKIDVSAGDDLLKQIDNIIESKNKVGIYSLSKSPTHSLLWAHYADSHKGFCIEYDLDILQNKLNSFAKHYCLNVVYSDSPSSININHLLNINKDKGTDMLETMFSTKHSDWDYEEETRLITDSYGAHYHDYRAVKSIFLGSRISEDHKYRLMETLQGRGITYYQMKTDFYKLKPVFEDDIFGKGPIYKYKIAPVNEGAVSFFDIRDEWKPFTSYLQKAVEVQRRDPYCEEVCYASFSIDKSKPGSPVIFVQYKYTVDGYMNRFFTIPQLDTAYSMITDLQ